MKYNERDLLLSIHAEYALKIVSGLKTIELRRRFPLFTEEDKKKIFIYACSPISKIIGECDLSKVEELPLKRLWNATNKFAMIDYHSFQKYFQNCDFGFALYLENPIKYKKPVSLKKVSGIKNQPPQSYRYISSQLAA